MRFRTGITFSSGEQFILNLGLYALTALLYGFLSAGHTVQKMQRTESLNAGKYQKLLENKRILGTVIFWNVFMFCIGVALPLEVSMIEEKLKMSSYWYGIGNAVEGVGMLLASAFVLGKISKLKPSSVIAIGLFCASLSYFVIGIAGNIGVYFVGACLVGITATFCPLGFKTEIQLVSNPETIGRTFATSRFFILLSRVCGSLVAGQMLQLCGIRAVYFVIAGILLVAAAVYVQTEKNKFLANVTG